MKKQLLVLSAAAMVAAAAVPAMAETTLYGSARLATFYNIQDTKATPAVAKSIGFDEHVQANSRFGANFSNGDVGGKVELGTGVNVRLLYGTAKFAAGTLLVGQDYNNYYLISEQTHGDDNVFNAYGALWDGRQPQIKFTMTNGLYFAAIQPTGNVAGTPDPTGAFYNNAAIKLMTPKMNVGYKGKAGDLMYNAGLVGQTFKNKTIDKQVTALLGYASVTAGFGATTLKANLSYGQNAGNMSFAKRMTYDVANKEDVSGIEGYVQLSQKLSDTLKANVGLGYASDESGAKNAKTDARMSAFVNAPITLAKNVIITPEVSYYDEMKNAAGAKQPKSYAVGAQWRIDF